MLKALVQRAVVASGLSGRWIRKAAIGSTAILAYHNIIPSGERRTGDGSLHLPQERFGDQLDALLESHDVVALDSILDPGRPPSPRPMAVITFDDAYSGALTAGLEELRRRSLPSTIFVNPGALDWEGFWWDLLADRDQCALDAHVRAHALSSLDGRQSSVLAWARHEGLRLVKPPDHARPANWELLSAASNHEQVTFGSHSWEHARLTALDRKSLESDLGRSLEWLRKNLTSTIDWLSYPYGLSSDRVESVAGELHTGSLLVTGGVLGPEADKVRTAMPRINVPSGLSADGLRVTLGRLHAFG